MFVRSFTQNSLYHKHDCDVVTLVHMHPSTHCDSPVGCVWGISFSLEPGSQRLIESIITVCVFSYCNVHRAEYQYTRKILVY